MKPLNPSSDSSLAQETRGGIGERMKRAFQAAVTSLAAPNCRNGLWVAKKIDRRRISCSPEEDSIRTIMFLGSWSHT
ncbi:hypothetical protein SAY86_002681 [Trapa natans]|uniref:Uncharacterized protein n=1 Tax=Trapa natans TaxID=22666 RepID=A0AAN7LU55_TRANT|nr:hypothetical protein SAY86_002681 [Trapa natans]